MLYKWTRVKPHTPISYHASYFMMPYQNMALTMMNSVGWVGGKTQRFGLCSLEHPVLDSPFRFEQRTDKKPS